MSDKQPKLQREIGPQDGASLPGGCKQCNAYQVVNVIRSGVWMVDVHHDPGCPVLVASKAQT